MFLLDTNAASDILKGRSRAAREAFQQARANTRVAISIITKAEILFGVMKRPDAVAFREAFDGFCEYVEVLPWTDLAAESYARLRYALKQRNWTVETMDLLIASQAQASGAIVVTRDNGFKHLEGLVEVVNWATDLSKKQ